MFTKRIELLNLVAQSRIDDVIAFLNVEDPRNEAGDTFALESSGIARQWQSLKRKKRMGLIRSSDETIESNIIVDQITQFIDTWY